MRTAKTLIRLADVQADPKLRWAHTHFVGFIMSRLNFYLIHSKAKDKREFNFSEHGRKRLSTQK